MDGFDGQSGSFCFGSIVDSSCDNEAIVRCYTPWPFSVASVRHAHMKLIFVCKTNNK